MKVEVPGRGELSLRYVVLDFNGTLALDGRVSEGVEGRLQEVAAQYSAYIVTANTFGTAGEFAARLGIECHLIRTGEDKAAFVRELGGEVAAIGNGRNDAPMFRAARLAIAVLGTEGLARDAWLAADVLAPSAERGLELLLHPKRLVASLRE